MSSEIFERTKIILKDEGIEKLKNSKVFLAGVGGVGSYVAESLARMGVGEITIVDHDIVSKSNINRQLIALHSTIGESKVEVMRKRINDINPDCIVNAVNSFIDKDNIKELLLKREYDCIVDAIDSLGPKVEMLNNAYILRIPTFSSMGSGGKVDPTKLESTKLGKTKVCPLAKHVRKKVMSDAVRKWVRVVYSTEQPRPFAEAEDVSRGRSRVVNGTVSYLPALFGLTLSGLVLMKLTGEK